MKTWNKLDQYDYTLVTDPMFGVTEVDINNLDTYDVINITQGFVTHDNRIYVDGHRLLYADHHVDDENNSMRIMVHEQNLGV